MPEEPIYTVENMSLGPCAVMFDSVPMGGTKGGIKIPISIKAFDFKCDQEGEQVVKSIQVGAEVSVDMTLIEFTSTIINKMAGFTGGVFSSVPGRDRLALAKELTLTEIGGTGKTLTFHKAILDPTNFNFPGSAEREVAVKFTCHKVGGDGADADDVFTYNVPAA